MTTKIPDTGSGKRRPPAIAAWEAIVDETRQWPGDVVISNEWFAPASREQAERAISHWAWTRCTSSSRPVRSSTRCRLRGRRS